MQNFLLQSEDFNSASWTKQAGVTITPNAALAPDNISMTADLVDVTSAGVGTGLYQITNYVGPAGTAATLTRGIWLRGDVGGEIVTMVDSAHGAGSTTCPLTINWEFFTYQSLGYAGDFACGIWLKKVSGNKFYAWGATLACANWCGDYVKTTTVAINTGRPRNLVQKQNLVNNSTNLSVAYNVIGIGSFTASGLGPNNEPNACTRITDNTDNSIHYVAPRVTSLGLGVYTVNAIVRPINGCSFGLVTTDGSSGRGIIVDGTTGTFSATTTNGSSMSILNYSIINLPNGLLSVSVTVEFLSLIPYNVAIIIDKPKTAVWGWGYVGAGDAIEVYNIQLVKANWADGITFTNGTALTNPVRNIVQKQNLLPYSNAFATNWTNTACSTVANSANTTAPDGTSTAVEFKEDAGLSIHRVTTAATVSIGKVHTFSVFIKKGTRTFAALQYDSGSRFGNVNLNTGETAVGQAGTSMTAKLLANGWVRVDITGTLTTGGNVYIYPATGLSFTDITFQGVLGDIAMYIWQAQLVQANHAGDLQPTVGTPITNPIRDIVQQQNLLTDPSNFASANWTKRGTCTVTPNQAISPVTGLMTADLITGMGIPGASDMFNANYNSILINPAGTPFTASIFIKRVSTSGILNFQNPVTFEKGLWTIDFAQLQDDVWYRVMPGMPGFTEVYKFVSGPSAGILMGASVSNFSFYVDNAQVVKANWAGDPQPNTNNSPIRNIVQKQNLLANSSDLTTWPKAGVFTVTGGELDPEGNSTAFKMTSNIVNPVIRAVGRRAKCGAIYTASVWLRTDTPFSTYLEYLDANDGDPPYQKKISVTTEWERYDVTSAPLPATASLDNMNVFIGDRFSTWPIGNSLSIWQPQLTEANWAGDLIKTTGTVVDSPIRNII